MTVQCSLLADPKGVLDRQAEEGAGYGGQYHSGVE